MQSSPCEGSRRCFLSEGTPLLQPQTNIPTATNNMTQIFCTCHRLANRKLVVDLLAILFGISAWISVNGMFVQLPLMVQTQPEHWNLPSYLSVIIQIANIGPILYSFSLSFLHKKIKDEWIIYVLLLFGTTALLLLSFFYQETTVIAGSEHSTALFVLSFFGALVGCTSSVLFMPFMANFREIYLISYFIGEGLSGFLPSIVSLIQGVGGNPQCIPSPANETVLLLFTEPPRFTTDMFYLFLFVAMSLSTLAFFLLNTLSVCQSERTDSSKWLDLQKASQSKQGNQTITNNPIFTIREDIEALMKESDGKHSLQKHTEGNKSSNNNNNNNETSVASSTKPLSRYTYFYLLILAYWVCMFGNGIFPSIQSYSCLPYGNVAYHLSVTLGSIANPIACFLAFFYPYTSVSVISILTSISTIITGYIMATALLSPAPPLVDSTGGGVLVVLTWVAVHGLITYVKVSIATVFRRDNGRSLFWCGAVQQIGSAVGALVSFFLINYTVLFSSYNPCA